MSRADSLKKLTRREEWQGNECCKDYLRQIWHEIVGNAIRIVTDFTRGMVADWVEIPQDHDAPVVARLGKVQRLLKVLEISRF